MRYLMLAVSALVDLARALAPAARRRRSDRVRRYAARPLPPRPSVATGPIPVILPSARTGVAVPPLPPRPVLSWESPEPAVDLDAVRRAKVARLAVGQPGRHARTGRALTPQHVGMIRLIAIAHHQGAEHTGAAA